MSLRLVSNHLSIQEHINRVLSAKEKMRDGLYEFVNAIKDAYEQLEKNAFQNDLCSKLDMRKTELSKWISISKSEFITSNIQKLPSSFTSLYTITLIEKKYKIKFGEAAHYTKLKNLIKHNEISKYSERSDLELILKRITQEIRLDEQIKREQSLLSLSGGQLTKLISSKTIEEYLDDKSRFRSFVVIPSEKQIARWSDIGLLQNDIAEEFPLQDLRSPSVNERLSCLIKIQMNHIDTGIKLLNSWGFSYRDTIVPPITTHYCSILNNEFVVVRGERGTVKKLEQSTCFSLDTEDLLDFADTNYSGPNLLVFEKTLRKDWSCLTQ